jgi:DNA-binding LacI/PurR family transcriptional regulator
VRVPEQLSVVGFDDIPMAKVTVPGLTTIRMPIGAMAAEAVALAVAPGRSAGAATLRVFPPTLVLRESTAPPPGDDAAAERAAGVLEAAS